jgi:tight adherence protein B
MSLPHFDAKLAVLVLVFAAVFTLAQSVAGLVRVGVARRAVNRRLQVAERGGSIGELVLELRKQRGLGEDGKARGGFLADLVLRSGVPYEPRKWALYVGLVAMAGFLLAFLVSHNALVALVGAAALGAGGPLLYLKVLAGRREKALGEQLPGALEVVVRSLEAGHPVPTAIALVGRELPDPIGTEFGMAGDEIAYGSTLEAAIGAMAERCRHADIDLFAATIRLQERSGGNLVGLLKMNAHTVRERQKMRLKIKAASSEGRVSAMILTAAPLLVMGVMQVAQPGFYGSIIHERSVQMILAGMGAWLLIGNLVMRRMIDMRI